MTALIPIVIRGAFRGLSDDLPANIVNNQRDNRGHKPRRALQLLDKHPIWTPFLYQGETWKPLSYDVHGVANANDWNNRRYSPRRAA